MKKKLHLLSALIVLIYSFFAINTFAVENSSFTENEVTFAQLSDIHIWSKYQKKTNKPTFPEILLKKAIAQINSNKAIDFTLITGDIVDAPNNELFSHVVSIFNLLNKPWYLALGNHDCSWPNPIPKAPLINILKNTNPDFVPNGRYYAFHPKKGFTFIGLDGSSYLIDIDQKRFLDTTIKSNPNDIIVIFLHTPIMPPIDLPTHTLWQTDELLNYFKQFKQPIAIFAGHFHATKIIQDGNIIHVASPSLRYSQEYRVVNIQNRKDKVIFNFIYKNVELEDDYQGENYPGKGFNMGRYFGRDCDKDTFITIYKD